MKTEFCWKKEMIKCCLFSSKARKKAFTPQEEDGSTIQAAKLHLLEQTSFNKQHPIRDVWPHISTNTSNMRPKRTPYFIHELFFYTQLFDNM